MKLKRMYLVSLVVLGLLTATLVSAYSPYRQISYALTGYEDDESELTGLMRGCAENRDLQNLMGLSESEMYEHMNEYMRNLDIDEHMENYAINPGMYGHMEENVRSPEMLYRMGWMHFRM